MNCDVDNEPAFLSLATCRDWEALAERWGVSVVARGQDPSKEGFLEAYAAAQGRKDRLSCYWRTKRRNFCARHVAQLEQNSEPLWRTSGLYRGLPTRRAMGLIMWAYHPEPKELVEALAIWRELAKAKGWLAWRRRPLGHVVATFLRPGARCKQALEFFLSLLHLGRRGPWVKIPLLFSIWHP